MLTGSADQTARLWNPQTGELLRNFVGDLSPVLYIGFADNGKTVVTGDDQNVYRWQSSLDDVIAFTCGQLCIMLRSRRAAQTNKARIKPLALASMKLEGLYLRWTQLPHASVTLGSAIDLTRFK